MDPADAAVEERRGWGFDRSRGASDEVAGLFQVVAESGAPEPITQLDVRRTVVPEALTQLCGVCVSDVSHKCARPLSAETESPVLHGELTPRDALSEQGIEKVGSDYPELADEFFPRAWDPQSCEEVGRKRGVQPLTASCRIDGGQREGPPEDVTALQEVA